MVKLSNQDDLTMKSSVFIHSENNKLSSRKISIFCLRSFLLQKNHENIPRKKKCPRKKQQNSTLQPEKKIFTHENNKLSPIKISIFCLRSFLRKKNHENSLRKKNVPKKKTAKFTPSTREKKKSLS